MQLLLVMGGGALGAGARHLVGRAVLGWLGPSFPWWTLGINVSGSLMMGVLAGAVLRFGAAPGPAEAWRLFLGVGVLGGFTTFSAFSLEAVTLWQRGQAAAAGAYVAASVAGGVAALLAGMTVMGRPA